MIPADAHIRLAAHENNGGLRILRRGYSFTDGIDATGNLLGGSALFLCPPGLPTGTTWAGQLCAV